MAGWHHRLDGHEFGSSDSKTSASSIPGSGRSPGEGKGYTPVFWLGEFHGLYRVTKSQTRLSDFHFHFYRIKSMVGPTSPF